ncbi:MAG: branched-chain amino acid transporter substrate-binding protein [Myxococcaceae bacterium]|nr:branched-chain amino acid transporter substrate-binding protein [Myxococcaceae bacterium]
MTRSSYVLFSTLLAMSTTACRKSEPAPAQEGSEQQLAAPAATPEAAGPIKLGQIMPYSGPASAFGTIGKLHAAFFAKVNREGGINGRKVELSSLDDSYSPPKAVEQVRKLVEQDHVLAIFNPVGTPSNSAIQKYLNEKQTPQLFVATGASKWNDPTHYPWTIGFNPSYSLEGKTYAAAVLKSNPKAKIAVLYQNDDFGKDVLAGLKAGLGAAHEKMIVAEVSYEVTDPTVDSQLVTLKGSKADTFINIATPKFAAQAIRKVADLGWKPAHYIVNISSSVGTVLEPAGLDKAKGLFTVAYIKDPVDPQWDQDPAMLEWRAFMKAEYPEGKLSDASNPYAYVTAQTLVEVLKKCGDDVSPKNLIAQAASLHDFAPGLLLPGVKINTSATDFEPFDQLQLAKFDGKTWVAVP